MTHIEQQRKQIKHTEDTVLTLTGVSHTEYAEHQYSCGLKYIGQVCKDDTMAAEEIVSSKIFWNWWKIKWAEREHPFCTYDILDIEIEYRVIIWRQIHNPLLLANGAYEAGKMMEESFAQIIGQIIKLTIKSRR